GVGRHLIPWPDENFFDKAVEWSRHVEEAVASKNEPALDAVRHRDEEQDRQKYRPQDSEGLWPGVFGPDQAGEFVSCRSKQARSKPSFALLQVGQAADDLIASETDLLQV